MHFILFGRNEKRSAVAVRNPTVEQGRMLPDSAKPALLLVLHEASRTGAPILGYNLVRFLSRQFNVVTWLMKPGVLEQDIAKFSVAVVKAPGIHAELADMAEEIIRRYGIDVAILNSAACNPMSDVIYELKVPIVSLVHEFKDYVLPRGAASKLAMFSDTVICPSDLILNSIAEECRDYAGWMPRHLASRHQGHCQLPQFAKSEHGGKARELPLKIRAALARKAGRPVILGAGWVHMRKGVELFIQAAQIYRETVDKDVLFVWVGGGYNPTGELNYSVWLQSQINIAGLEDTVIFAEEARTLQPFYDAAHGFFLSSRLDPFPNVAIDSAMAGLPVAVFDQATGFADVIRQAPDLGRIIPFLDLNAAVKILDGMVTERRADAGQKERIAKQAREIFDFAGYAEFVAEKCHGALWNFGRTQAAAADLIEAGDFDERFFRSGLVNGYLNQLHETPAELLYLDLARKGFHPAKPRPGLNGAVGDESAGSPVVPAKIPAYSHPVHHLQFPVVQEASGSEINLRIAAHIHAFETKGIMEIVSRLADGPMAIDLFITSDEHSKLDEMQDGLIGIDNAVTWIRTPNRGRDIGPFLCGLPDEFWGHDVVGHFHVKASSHLDRQMTEQWKTFVYEHLIDGPDVLRQIFWRFESDPKLGLLFAEDPCQIGWTKNAKIAAELALRLGLEGPLPPAPEFPIGNMFWARSGALEPLRRLKLDWDDLPDEPVPSDGTLLHALERLTPAICGKAGYRWATVHRPDTQRFAKRRS